MTHAQPDQIGDLLHRRPHRAGQGHAAHRRHRRPDREPSGARLGPGGRRRRDRRPAAVRRVHERVPGGQLDLRARSRCWRCWSCSACWSRSARCCCACQRLAFGAAARPDRAGRRRSYVPMFAHLALVLIAGIYLPGAAGGLVPARRGAAGLSRWACRTLIADLLATRPRRSHRHVPWPRVWSMRRAWAGGRATARRRRAGRCSACGASRTACTWRCCEADASRSPCSASTAPTALSFDRPRCTRRRSAWNARSRDLYRPRCRRRRIRAHGSTTALARSRPLARDARPPTVSASCRSRATSLHQIPVGPVHAGIIEPGHFRFTADGETVVRLEAAAGLHPQGRRGADARRRPRATPPDSPAASRGDSTVAYAFAFARAVEAAAGIDAAAARGAGCARVMAELERIANHLGDVGAICNDASFAIMLAHCGMLRERVLRAAAAVLRPPADDGPHRARRRRRRPRPPTAPP